MRGAWLLAPLAACSFSKSLSAKDASGDAEMIDGPPVVIDAPANFTCLGTTTTTATNAFEVCVDPAGLGGVPLSGNIDTTSDSKCAAPEVAKWTSSAQPPACFIIGTSITFTGDITVTGTRPLVLFATASISASSRILDASGMGTTSGPGPQICGMFQRVPGTKGGGAGGTFMTTGGSGGDNLNGQGLGGISPAPSTAPTTLRGGCQGQTGGGNNAGGGGGGAVYLVAGTTIDLGSSKIDLSGGGGSGAAEQEEGGGGGGSGGMLMMFAESNIVGGSSKLNANGGGGGGGGGNNSTGGPGSDPDPDNPNVAGSGGTASMGGGVGGDGYPSLAPGGVSSMNDGGGGGGGGAGYIRANRAFATSGGTSPNPAIIL